MPSIHKRARDVVGEVDGGSNTSEERRCENKRSRMHSEDSQTSSEFHSSPDNLPLSTNDQLSGSTTVEDDTKVCYSFIPLICEHSLLPQCYPIAPMPTSSRSKQAGELNGSTDVGGGYDQESNRCSIIAVPLQHRRGGRMSVRRPIPPAISDEDSSDEEQTSGECSSDVELLGMICNVNCVCQD